MKKIRLKANKNSTWGLGSRLHPSVGIIVVVLTALIGIATLKFSLADNSGNILIHIKDVSTGASVSGVAVSLDPANEAATPCNSGYNATSQGDGNAYFYGCTTWTSASNEHYVISRLDVGKAGYQVTANSPKKIGGDVTTAPGWNATWDVYVTPTDSDGDGVPDKNDQCPNVAGPASNQGCPIPAPTPAAPAAPAPSTTSSPATPANNSAGDTTAAPAKPNAPKRTADTITANQSSTDESSPAVVVATSGDATPPSAPTDLTLDLNGTTAFLSWTSASDNVGVTGYDVERSTDKQHWESVAQDIADTFYTDQVVAGKHYYYRVRALDDAGNKSVGAQLEISAPAGKSSKSGSPSTRKTGAVRIAATSAGIIFILVAFFVAVQLFRRRMQNSAYVAPGGYDVSQPLPMAVISPDMPAAHTSVSLKDMVLEDMNKHPNPPQPPLPPLPPQPPGP